MKEHENHDARVDLSDGQDLPRNTAIGDVPTKGETQWMIETDVFQREPSLDPFKHPKELSKLMECIQENGLSDFDLLPVNIAGCRSARFTIDWIPIRAVAQYAHWHRDRNGNVVDGWKVRLDVLARKRRGATATKTTRNSMTVHELITRLTALPQDAEIMTQFDVSDHDTLWNIVDVVVDDRAETVVIVAA